MLLAAELEGAPVNFTRVVVEQGAGGLDGEPEGAIRRSCRWSRFPWTVRWSRDRSIWCPRAGPRSRRSRRRKRNCANWLALAGVIYLVFLLAAAAYIIWLQRQVGAIDAQVAAATPAVETIASRKARWTALGPATDPTRYTVEILQQINKSIPSGDLHVTVFDQTPAQFMVEGEAPTASMAIQYMDALRANPDLKAFHFDARPARKSCRMSTLIFGSSAKL